MSGGKDRPPDTRSGFRRAPVTYVLVCLVLLAITALAVIRAWRGGEYSRWQQAVWFPVVFGTLVGLSWWARRRKLIAIDEATRWRRTRLVVVAGAVLSLGIAGFGARETWHYWHRSRSWLARPQPPPGVRIPPKLEEKLAESERKFRRLVYIEIAIPAAFTLLGLLGAASHVWIWRHATRRLWRAEGRCEKCGYSLKALTQPRCPECGTPFDPEKLGAEL